MQKLADLNIGITTNDPTQEVVQKLERFLKNYQPDKRYADDFYALESNREAFASVKEGGYGIGAILVDEKGNVIARGHNEQIQKHRSDLHGEMSLMSNFEDSPASKPYLNFFIYRPGLLLFSSAEPCPMCFVRITGAQLDFRYSTPGPEDGMANRVSCLPGYWNQAATQRKFSQGNCSPVMQKILHLLFFSYLLDNRGPQ